MKKPFKINKDIILFILLFVVFLVVVLFTSDRSSVKQPDYTVFSAGDKGVGLLYDTYKQMELPVEVYQKNIKYAELTDIQIIVQPDYQFDTDEDFGDIAEFVNNGGNLVCLADNGMLLLRFMADKNFKQSSLNTGTALSLYSYGKGQIIYASAGLFTNKGLYNDKSAGIELLKLIDSSGWKYGKIYFNEYYHGYGQKENLWVALPTWGKQAVFLFLFYAGFVIIYLGKRFGKAKPYFDETERDENEYAKAVGRLYQSALLYNKIADNYFYDFIYKCCIYFKIDLNASMISKVNTIRRKWSEYNFSDKAVLENVLNYEKLYAIGSDTKIKKSDYNELIHSIEKLNTILEKGSDYKWR